MVHLNPKVELLHVWVNLTYSKYCTLKKKKKRQQQCRTRENEWQQQKKKIVDRNGGDTVKVMHSQ